MKKKKILIMSLIAAIALSLAACGNEKDNGNSNSDISSANEVADSSSKTSGDWEYLISHSSGGIWLTGYKGSKSEVEIPEKIDGMPVTRIASFYLNNTIKKVTISDGVEEIGFECFAESSIKEVVISASIKKIEMAAFSKCDNLTDIYYEDSEAQWNNIDIGDTNESLSNAAIHYNEN